MMEKKSSTPVGGSLSSSFFLGFRMGLDGDIWEEVPDEDLWEDGELESEQIKEKIFQKAIRYGEWKLIRRKNG